MNLHSLKPAEGATKSSKRIGRGQGSGKGGTSTKGHKGAQSRSGYSRKLGFEGGQMPIYRLLPKRGFKNINRIEYSAINLDTLQKLAEKLNVAEIGVETLMANGLAKKKDLVKILGKGELTAKIAVTAHAFSKSAIDAIEKAGGSVMLINTSKAEDEVKSKAKTKEEPISEVKQEVVEIKEKVPVEEIKEIIPEVKDETPIQEESSEVKEESEEV